VDFVARADEVRAVFAVARQGQVGVAPEAYTYADEDCTFPETPFRLTTEIGAPSDCRDDDDSTSDSCGHATSATFPLSGALELGPDEGLPVHGQVAIWSDDEGLRYAHGDLWAGPADEWEATAWLAFVIDGILLEDVTWTGLILRHPATGSTAEAPVWQSCGLAFVDP
jgi:hypothetical protein